MFGGLPELLAKRAVKYLVRRFFGQYLESFSHDELSIDFNKGIAVLEDVSLNVEALNELCKKYNMPVNFVSGTIKRIVVEIPLLIFVQNSVFKFSGVHFVVQAKNGFEDMPLISSMWESMTSSYELAEDWLLQTLDNDPDFEPTGPAASVEIVANTFSAVLAKLKLEFTNVTVRIECTVEDTNTVVALDAIIKSAEFYDEAGVESLYSNDESTESSSYCVKTCLINGIEIYTAQYPIGPQTRVDFYASSPTQLPAGSPEMPPPHYIANSKKIDYLDQQSEPILVCRISGRQQIQVNLKQNESVIGPKVDIKVNLGQMNLFITPYQIEMLINLACGLAEPGKRGTRRPGRSLTSNNKPMLPEELASAREEIRAYYQRCNASRSLQNQQGWSSHSLEESNEEFHLMRVEPEPEPRPIPQNTMLDDLELSYSSSIGSEKNFTTGSPSSHESTRIRRSSRGSNSQNFIYESIDQTQLQISCSTLLVVALHEDMASDSANSEQMLIKSKTEKNSTFFSSRAGQFFHDLCNLSIEGLNFKDFPSTREKLSSLCQTNHLRLLASGVKFEGIRKVSALQQQLSASLSMMDLEVLECVYNSSGNVNVPITPTYTELVSFNMKSEKLPNSVPGNQTDPCLKLKYDKCSPGVWHGRDQPADKLVIHLAPVAFELDISLLDRIQYLLQPTPLASGIKQSELFVQPDVHDTAENMLDMENVSRPTRTEIAISSKFVILNLRFPIPDLRPVHSMERMPWWKQNLRKEIFVMELSDASISFKLDDKVEQLFLIKCRDFHGLLQMSQNEKPISFMRVSVDPEIEKTMQDGGFDWPSLIIKCMPPALDSSLVNEFRLKEEPSVMTYTDILYANINTGPSPFYRNATFCGKKYRQTDDGDTEVQTFADEKIIRPADKANFNDFLDNILGNSQYVFNFTLPTVNLVLPNKDVFEVLKNRLFTDLPLWQRAPVNTYPLQEQCSTMVPSINLNPLLKNEEFTSQSEDPASGSDDEDKSITYHSVNEYMTKHKTKVIKKDSFYKSVTKFSFLVTIVKGSMLIDVPAEVGESVEEEQYCGKLQIFVEDSRLIVASCYENNPDESYTCLQMSKGSLYHASHEPQSEHVSVVPPYTCSAIPKSNQIIYASEPGVLATMPSYKPEKLDLMAISVHSVDDPKQQIKTFKLAIGFSGATLRHFMCPKNQLFINQFIQFMKLEDELIDGYTPSSVVVELHLHLSHCAVDYRPLYLPLKTMLTVQEFSLSTNITSANSSLMRIVFEDLRLFLSTDLILQNVILKESYVCVIETGLIDLSVRVTEIEGKTEPKFEMSMMNDIIRVRTCVDSFQALHKLLVYLANNPDEKPNARSRTTSTHSVVDVSDDDSASSEDYTSPDVQELMLEATRECEDTQSCMPDDDYDYDSIEQDFCFIDDIGSGVRPRDGDPGFKQHEGFSITGNHYGVPSGRLNLLKAPKQFPKAIYSHVLKEMSVLWRIYGGNDFPIAKTPVKKHGSTKDSSGSPVRFVDDFASIRLTSDRASFCKVTPLTKDFNVNQIHYAMENFSDRTLEEDRTNGWISRGGPGRDHKLLMDLHMKKVQYQHEEYAEDSEYASRDILIIHDLEIKDEMAGSQINKFLHQYSTESMPRQTNANMLVIKAVYVRPDQRQDNQECMLSVSCKPLKLNMKQDSVMFLYDFFKEFSQSASPCSSPVVEVQSPVGSPSDTAYVGDNQRFPKSQSIGAYQQPSNLTFFRSFKFYPEVLIKIDYKGQRIDMDKGALSGIMLGLGSLERSEVILKKLNYRHGLLGAEKLITYAVTEWINDIRSNQVSGILKGIGPVQPFVQLVQGFRDLFWLPVEQYRRDGQIVRGFRRGASSFSTSTATACLELGTFVIGFIQGAAEIAYDMVSPGPSVTERMQRGSGVGRQVTQPADVREGVASALAVVREGFEGTARSLARAAAAEHEHKGVQGAVGGVLRQIPSAAIMPFIATAEASCIFFDGVKHQLNPDSHKEAMEKWKTKKP